MSKAQDTLFRTLADPTRRAIFERLCREGRNTHYSAQLTALRPLLDCANQMAGFWESRFDDLDEKQLTTWIYQAAKLAGENL